MWKDLVALWKLTKTYLDPAEKVSKKIFKNADKTKDSGLHGESCK